LVTGGGGFLGATLVRQLLAEGYEVRGFSRRRYPDLERLGATWVSGDLREANRVSEACRDVDVVFHTAAFAGVWGSWKTYHGINVEGTRHVIQGCQRHSVRHLVYTSSPSVTFDGGDQEGVDESAPYPRKFLAHYPHSKAIAEQEVLAANNEGEGLRTCALRPHLIWGPDDPHLIPRLVDRARRGRLRKIGDGKNLVDICYVDNAAEAHRLAAADLFDKGRAAGRAYFISQGEPVCCWDWINEVLQLAGQSPVNRSISYRAAYAIGAVLEGVYACLRRKNEPPMTRFVAAQLATSHFFDITAAKRDFGYRVSISTAEGMDRLRRAWQERAENHAP
jgi:nucleoside-diphosphate-sugar epimerase